MNYQSTMRLAKEFDLEDKGTVEYVRDTLLPGLKTELEHAEECERQFTECGLPNYLADTQEELVSVISQCEERLKRVRV